MGIAKCSKLAAVASSFGQRFVGVKCWGELFHTSSVRKFISCWLITLWFCNRPAMGTKLTLGILFRSLASWMRWAVLPRWGEHCTGVAASAVGIGHRRIAGVIGGEVPGTLFRVMRQWTRLWTSVLALPLDLAHSLWKVRLTLGEGLAILLCLGWYLPFVQRLGPPFVGPASVPAAGHLMKIFFWQDPCVAWAHEEGWPLRLYHCIG